ncbi:hypothetical protein HG531_011628 [Fusarium graminearum]|nr:hypothetical protein HG531_011628 [Fusarium graminearum]
MHGAESLAYSKEKKHKAALGEAIVVDQVRIDHILFVSATLGRNRVVNGRDDGRDVGEEAIGVDLAHGLLD